MTAAEAIRNWGYSFIHILCVLEVFSSFFETRLRACVCAVLYVCSVCVSGRPESESSRVASRSSWGRVEHAEQQRIKSLENTKLSARLQKAAAKAAKETQNKQQGRQPILQEQKGALGVRKSGEEAPSTILAESRAE